MAAVGVAAAECIWEFEAQASGFVVFLTTYDAV